MVRMADDHYELDISRARQLLGWEPRHRLKNALPAMVKVLKDDPAGWYKANNVTPPPVITEAAEAGHDPEAIRRRHETRIRSEEHTSELQSLMRISYAVLCLKKKKRN